MISKEVKESFLSKIDALTEQKDKEELKLREKFGKKLNVILSEWNSLVEDQVAACAHIEILSYTAKWDLFFETGQETRLCQSCLLKEVIIQAEGYEKVESIFSGAKEKVVAREALLYHSYFKRINRFRKADGEIKEDATYTFGW